MPASAPAVLSLATPWLDDRLISDEDGHPTAAGDAVIARFLLGELPKLECRCLAETGRYGRCGACGHGAGGTHAAAPKSVTEHARGAKTPAAPSVDDTPIGQTISMFSLLDE